MRELFDVRRADFLFAFGNHHQIHRYFLVRPSNRVQRGQKRRFRSFLIDRTATDDRFAQPRPTEAASAASVLLPATRVNDSAGYIFWTTVSVAVKKRSRDVSA